MIAGRASRWGRGALAALALAGAPAVAAERLEYPAARRVDQVDDYHGERVADPYRWLEDTASAETRDWVAAENALTRSRVGNLPSRAYFAGRLRALIDYERHGLPQHEAGRYVYEHNSGTQEQDTVWVTPDPAAPGRLLLDPNALGADGTISLGDHELSPDGQKLAYALSDGGTDWKTWRVRDTETGKDWPEVLRPWMGGLDVIAPDAR